MFAYDSFKKKLLVWSTVYLYLYIYVVCVYIFIYTQRELAGESCIYHSLERVSRSCWMCWRLRADLSLPWTYTIKTRVFQPSIMSRLWNFRLKWTSKEAIINGLGAQAGVAAGSCNREQKLAGNTVALLQNTRKWVCAEIQKWYLEYWLHSS